MDCDFDSVLTFKQRKSNGLDHQLQGLEVHQSVSPQQEQVPQDKVSGTSLPNRDGNLRFSFEETPDQSLHARGNQTALDQSFQEMHMAGSIKQNKNTYGSHESATKDQRFSVQAALPDLSKPKKKKKEGYGFSYSETFWHDSDEYPDTECGSDTEEETSQPIEYRPSTLMTKLTSAKQEAVTSQLSFRSSATTIQNESFDDIVVLRDVGSFHIARPQKIMECTIATREDTIHLKTQAKLLFQKYRESSEIQADLLSRLERMILAEQHTTYQQAKYVSIEACTLRLQTFLSTIKVGRLETGEHPRLIEHEIEWAKWLVEASRTGVMHLKTGGCKCRPDWEED